MSEDRTALHVGVRLERGGAARVARTLGTAMRSRGYTGRFAYGYGPGGADSPEEATTGALRTTSGPRAFANAASHALVGRELVPPGRLRLDRLVRVAAASDVIHLHAVHSYMGPPATIVRRLLRTGRPVVWTLHDYWLLTGRCALPGGCTRWSVGCGHCPDLRAYPPAALDLTRSGAHLRRRWVADLTGVVFVAPSAELARSFRAVYPGLRVERIPNGVDAAFVDAVVDRRDPGERRGWAVVADDLADPGKVPPEVVRSLTAAGVPLHLVGRHNPYRGPGVIDHGHLADRAGLATLLRSVRGLLFLSGVDIFSMVLLEALCVGTPVLALPSANAAEALAAVGATPLPGRRELVRAVVTDRAWAGWPAGGLPSPAGGESPTPHVALAHRARERFATGVMVGAYADLYDELLVRASAPAGR